MLVYQRLYIYSCFYIPWVPGPSEVGPQGQATAGGTIGAWA